MRHLRLPWPLSASWVMLTRLVQPDRGDSFITHEASILGWEREWTHRTYQQKLWYMEHWDSNYPWARCVVSRMIHIVKYNHLRNKLTC